MFYFDLGKYIVKLLDFDNKNELNEVFSLRYEHLLRDFNNNLPEGGLDDDGNDIGTDSILVIDKDKNIIVGTYRLATLKTKNGIKFLTEHEFDISPLINSGENILELGRAVVHKDYRDGAVINLLWASILEYCKQFDIRYMFGTCSLHGTNPHIHDEVLSYLKTNCKDNKFNIRSIKNSFEYPDIILDDNIINKIPPLLKAYLLLGATVSANGYIDYDFNSCDVLTLVDVKSLDKRKIDFFTRRLHK